MRGNIVLKVGEAVQHQPEHAVAISRRRFAMGLDLDNIGVRARRTLRLACRLLTCKLIEAILEMPKQRIRSHGLLDRPSLGAGAGQESAQDRAALIAYLDTL